MFGLSSHRWVWQGVLMVAAVVAPSSQSQNAENPPANAPNAPNAPNQATPQPLSNAPPPRGVTDVEILLQLTEAERNFDRVLTEARLPDCSRIHPKFDQSKMAELRQSLQILLQRIDAMVVSDKVLPARRDETKLKKLSVLYEATKIDRATFGGQFDACIDQLLNETRKDEGNDRKTASLVTAYRMLDRFVDSQDGNEKVFAAIDQFIQSYPTTPWGFQLYLCRANNLREIGDNAGAMEVYRKAEDAFKEEKRSDIIRSIVKRMELCGQPASIKGPTLDGGEFDIESLKGKVVLVDFWASWCGPCVDAFPALVKLKEKYGEQGLEIVGVSLDENRDEIKSTLDRMSATWPQIVFEGEAQTGFDNPIAQTYSVNFVPTYFLVDREGKFVSTESTDLIALERLIARLVSGAASPANPTPKADEPQLVPVQTDKTSKP